jgi:flagellar biosynthesis anti-sigma factor FlgM
MNVRIHNQSPAEISTEANSSAGRTQAMGGASSQSATSKPGAGEDTATISSATSQLAGNLPIRQDRVNALRSQIESGTYTVDAHAVANAMLQNYFRS